MSIESTENRVKAAQKELALAMDEIEQLKKAGDDPRWKPKYDEACHYVNSGGEVRPHRWLDTDADRKLLANGNVFKTREQAEKHAKRLSIFNLSWAYAASMGSGLYTMGFCDDSIVTTNFCNLLYGLPKVSHSDVCKIGNLIGKSKIKGAWSNE